MCTLSFEFCWRSLRPPHHAARATLHFTFILTNYHELWLISLCSKPWRRGAVDITSVSWTRRPGFESHKGIRFLGRHSRAVVYDLICIVFVLKGEIKALATNKKYKKTFPALGVNQFLFFLPPNVPSNRKGFNWKHVEPMRDPFLTVPAWHWSQGCQMVFSYQKIPICVNFGGSSNGKCWYILCTFGQFSGHLVYFMSSWYIFPRLVHFYPFWYVVPRPIWQPWLKSLQFSGSAQWYWFWVSRGEQGDPMILWKSSPKFSPNHFVTINL
jgi:hypothetical protein